MTNLLKTRVKDAKGLKKCPPHRYKRKNLTRDAKKEPFLVFKCMECPHYIRTELAAGLEARCYKCNEPFIISAKQASITAKPICEPCIVKSSKTKKLEAEVDSLMDEILKGEF